MLEVANQRARKLDGLPMKKEESEKSKPEEMEIDQAKSF